jgi:hypothetical protein
LENILDYGNAVVFYDEMNNVCVVRIWR